MIMMDNSIIEAVLQKYKPVLDLDYEKYSNHVYRVFLNCILIDPAKINEEKYAIASVFHDIGIWTNRTIDYLDPSVEQANIYLREAGKLEWLDEIALMINWHHKMSPYHGSYESTVECFRKADWIDVSFGLLSFGVDRQKIKDNRRKIVNGGFHIFLVKKIIKNFFMHPRNPLPMFKK